VAGKASLGIDSLSGAALVCDGNGPPGDAVGVAAIDNGISAVHEQYTVERFDTGVATSSIALRRASTLAATAIYHSL